MLHRTAYSTYRAHSPHYAGAYPRCFRNSPLNSHGMLSQSVVGESIEQRDRRCMPSHVELFCLLLFEGIRSSRLLFLYSETMFTFLCVEWPMVWALWIFQSSYDSFFVVIWIYTIVIYWTTLSLACIIVNRRSKSYTFIFYLSLHNKVKIYCTTQLLIAVRFNVLLRVSFIVLLNYLHQSMLRRLLAEVDVVEKKYRCQG